VGEKARRKGSSSGCRIIDKVKKTKRLFMKLNMTGDIDIIRRQIKTMIA
jgi:hypothetical protein